jgi:hypothetical protein
MRARRNPANAGANLEGAGIPAFVSSTIAVQRGLHVPWVVVVRQARRRARAASVLATNTSRSCPATKSAYLERRYPADGIQLVDEPPRRAALARVRPGVALTPVAECR